MTALIDALAQQRFAVFGRAGMDLYPDPPGTPTPEATQMSVGLGGSSANIAVGLCKFGGAAALITSISDDAVGWYCLNQLQGYGVDTQHMRRITGEYRTSLAVYESRIEDHQTVIYRNGAADFQIAPEDVDAIDFAAYSAFITTGTVFSAEPSRAAGLHAIDRARAAGLPIIFDVDYRPYSWPSPEVASEVLSRVGALSDVIVGNDEEFGFMAGDMALGLDKARSLAAESAEIVVYKMGPAGAVTFAQGDEIRTGIYPVTALKPTGAGDSFMAGFLSGLAVGQQIKDAVLRGSACAAIVVARPGCAPAMPDQAGLDAFLAEHPGPTDA